MAKRWRAVRFRRSPDAFHVSRSPAGLPTAWVTFYRAIKRASLESGLDSLCSWSTPNGSEALQVKPVLSMDWSSLYEIEDYFHLLTTNFWGHKFTDPHPPKKNYF